MSPTETHAAPTQQDLLGLGRAMVAYLRPAEMEGVSGFAIHGADGEIIGFAPTAAHAIVALREHEMELVHLH